MVVWDYYLCYIYFSFKFFLKLAYNFYNQGSDYKGKCKY